MKNSKRGENDAETTGSETVSELEEVELEDEVDALFKLPMGEFTGARNDLAARLKRRGHADDAKVVKALAKPPASAWAVNQLYWKHREAFDRLLAAGQRFREAQASGTAGQTALRESLEERREALSQLSELAAALLSDAGHNPAPDTIHRITTTLEALSAYASLSDGPTPGRLTRDLDPPGFEALASLITSAAGTKAKEEPTLAGSSRESGSAATPRGQKSTPSADVQKVRNVEEVHELDDLHELEGVRDLEGARRAETATAKVREIEETRRARRAAAQASLQDAERSLTEATARVKHLETARMKADEEAAEAERAAGLAEKQLRESEQRLKKASSAFQDAAERSQRIAAEAREAGKAVEDATRIMEKASKELELVSHEPEGR